MAVKIEAPPKPEALLYATCSGCKCRLSYAPIDVKNRRVSCMGDVDTYYYVTCPGCGTDTAAARHSKPE